MNVTSIRILSAGGDGNSLTDRISQYCQVDDSITLKPVELVIVGEECFKASDIIMNILEQLVSSAKSGAPFTGAKDDPRSGYVLT
jgi:hypothetical protein